MKKLLDQLIASVDKLRIDTKGTMRFPTFDPMIHNSILNHDDYFRYATIGLALNRILLEETKGNLAEVGVWRGNLSRFVHKIAPDRLYYLFDTFEGFPKQDLDSSAIQDNRWKDTSIDVVLHNLDNTDNVIIKKGYVPDTFEGLEDKEFALVMLDLDLFKPTLASLDFFYPRLNSGGYLIVHDYNSPESNWGSKRAFDEFMKNKPEKGIEIADMWGTIIFRRLKNMI